MTPMTMMSLRQDLWPSVSAVPALLRFEESFMELAPDRGGRVPRSFPDMKTTAKKTNRKSTNRKKLKTDRKEEHADNHGGGSLQVSRQKQPHGKFPPKIKESKSCPYEYVANEKANMAASRPHEHVAHQKANMASSRPHKHVANEKAGRKESPEQAGWLQRLVRQLTAIFFPGERRQAPFNIDLGIQFR